MRTILVFIACAGAQCGPDDVRGPLRRAGQEICRAGYEFLTQHHYQEARRAFEAGLQQQPANALAHFYLGEAC